MYNKNNFIFLEYIQQPPSTTLPEGCNPYDQNNKIRI